MVDTDLNLRTIDLLRRGIILLVFMKDHLHVYVINIIRLHVGIVVLTTHNTQSRSFKVTITNCFRHSASLFRHLRYKVVNQQHLYTECQWFVLGPQILLVPIFH